MTVSLPYLLQYVRRCLAEAGSLYCVHDIGREEGETGRAPPQMRGQNEKPRGITG
jgi:hypothetical protein